MSGEAITALRDRERAAEALLAACVACIKPPVARNKRAARRPSMKRSLS